MLKELIKASGSLSRHNGYIKSIRVKANEVLDISEIDDSIRVKDLANGTIIKAYIWGGSGYSKTPILLQVKKGYISPASSKDLKILVDCWNTDKKGAEAIVDYANESTSEATLIISLITDTESTALYTESELVGDDDLKEFVEENYYTYFENAKGETCYLASM